MSCIYYEGEDRRAIKNADDDSCIVLWLMAKEGDILNDNSRWLFCNAWPFINEQPLVPKKGSLAASVC